MKKLLYILIIGLAVASCKKEPLPPLPDDSGPYYSIQGYLDGEFIDLNVGQEGILISQNTKVENGVTYHYGQIISPNEDLLIRIEFATSETPYSAAGYTALEEGPKDFLIHQPTCKTFNFGLNQNQQNFFLIKNEDNAFEPVNEASFDQYGIHDITMKFTDDNNNTFQIPVEYGFGNQKLNPGFQTFPNADSVIFSAVDQYSTQNWYIDENYVSSEAQFTMPLSTGIHVVEHVVKDANNNEARYKTLVRITDSVLDWQMTTSNCSGSTPIPSNYGNVNIMIQTNGQQYRSSNAIENGNNSFIVNNVDYIGNSSMTPTRAVFDLTFDAVLINDDLTDSLSLAGISGTFNVGL